MLIHTASVVFHNAGPVEASGAAAYDKRGLCVACIVTWGRAGHEQFARILHTQIDGDDDLAPFVRAASHGAFRSDPTLSADFARLATVAQRGAWSPAGRLASLILLLRSWQVAWRARHTF